MKADGDGNVPDDWRDEFLLQLRHALRPISDEDFDARYSFLKETLGLCTEDEAGELMHVLLTNSSFFPTVSELTASIEKAFAGRTRWDVHDLHRRGLLVYLVRNFVAGKKDWPRGAGPRPEADDFPYPEVYNQVLQESQQVFSSDDPR